MACILLGIWRFAVLWQAEQATLLQPNVELGQAVHPDTKLWLGAQL